MIDNELQQVSDEAVAMRNYKIKLLAIGGTMGAVVGLFAAYLLYTNVEKTGERLQVSAREGLKLGVLLFGLVRSISNLWESK
jgi:hypothetical protein